MAQYSGLQGYFNMWNPAPDYYLGSIPQAVPIIAISFLSFTAEVITWLIIALTRHDVSYTANSAHYECLETRSSLYYPAKYLKVSPVHNPLGAITNHSA